MIGILVQLAISWLLIWFFEKKDLGVLGLSPTKRRLVDFILFFLLACFCCSIGFLLKIYFFKERWEVNPNLTANLLLDGIWWNLKSVLYEELIFRGVLLYIAIKKLGEANGIVLSAIAFGIYHWFSFNVFWDPKMMTFVFLYTGAMGLVWAYAYAKSKSLYIPIAIHFGWGLIQQVVFSSGPIGNQFLIPGQPKIEVTVSYFTLYAVQFFPIVFAPLLLFFILNRLNKSARWSEV
jgi:membrane protease YdiL (CAAX protease family)